MFSLSFASIIDMPAPEINPIAKITYCKWFSAIWQYFWGQLFHRFLSQKNSPPPFRRRNSFAISRHNASAGVLLSSTAIWVSAAREDSSPWSRGISVSSCQLMPNHERVPETSRFRWSKIIAIAPSGQRSAVIWYCQNCNLPNQPVMRWCKSNKGIMCNGPALSRALTARQHCS